MNKKIKRKSIGSRVAKGVITLTLLSTFSIGLFCYYIYMQDTMDSNANNASSIALSIANSIEPQRFANSVVAESEDDYWQIVKSSIDATKTQTDVEYLYILTKYSNTTFMYYAEGMKPTDSLGDIGEFGYVEENEGVFAQEAFDAINSKAATTTAPYVSDGFGKMVSGFAPIFDENKNVIAVVGVDISVSEVINSANLFGMYVAVASIIFSLISAFISRRYIKWLIGYCLRRITEGTHCLAEGNLIFKARSNDSNDEVGKLYSNFSKVIGTFSMLIEDMSNMFDMHANGEFEAKIDESKYVGAYYDVVKGINDMVFMYVNNLQELLEVVKSYGNGNFDANFGFRRKTFRAL